MGEATGEYTGEISTDYDPKCNSSVHETLTVLKINTVKIEYFSGYIILKGACVIKRKPKKMKKKKKERSLSQSQMRVSYMEEEEERSLSQSQKRVSYM